MSGSNRPAEEAGMTNAQVKDSEKESVQTYLQLIQDVISRMAGNSVNCKTWCVTIVSALFALSLEKGRPQAILVGFIPLALFCFLDAYYLSLEREFRNIYNSFIDDLHEGRDIEKKVYKLVPPNNCFAQHLHATFAQLRSFAILPFYGLILAALILAYFVGLRLTPAQTDSGAQPDKPPGVTRPLRAGRVRGAGRFRLAVLAVGATQGRAKSCASVPQPYWGFGGVAVGCGCGDVVGVGGLGLPRKVYWVEPESLLVTVTTRTLTVTFPPSGTPSFFGTLTSIESNDGPPTIVASCSPKKTRLTS